MNVQHQGLRFKRREGSHMASNSISTLSPNLQKKKKTLHFMRVGFCVNRSRKKGLRSYRNHWECLICSPRLWTHDEREKEEEEEQRTGEGPPACLRGGKPDTAYDFTNNVSFCTTDSGRVYLISKKWTLIEPQLYVGGEKRCESLSTQQPKSSKSLWSSSPPWAPSVRSLSVAAC